MIPLSLLVKVNEPTAEFWWDRVVEEFSKCKLTYAKDRLVAISGVAKWTQEHTGDEYLAGMWRADLDIALLWMTREKGSAPTIAPAQYIAPSWSWASVNKGVRFDDAAVTPAKYRDRSSSQYSILIQIRDVYRVPVDPTQPLGLVKDGRLRLSFQQGVMLCQEGDAHNRETSSADINFEETWDNARSGGENPTIYFLTILIDQWGPASNDLATQGIILCRAPSGTGGVFRRIGYFSTTDIHYRSLVKKGYASVPDISIYEEYNDGECVISII
ncbi:hypothetical protein CONLIGDRAFT_682834 [Coniochaeta ligniaria NRRL 30616]|uniref:Heterokaryon incompatibility domain-containing protein n=1 Tax=Coniochaeta ligniaria NRRL 30616 TaxID=1408157 RepID=A0A1J7JJJ0_9PEZI|nr:hypothetical protein CONLIGDRAFT_682834 [Coniochaeta ligniaria NRRL 30616]